MNKKKLYIYGLTCGTLAIIPTIYNSYWALFLSSAAGLSAAGMATVMSIIGIADVISIIVVSFIIQKCNLKSGKFRFWVLFGGIIAAITRVFAFSTIGSGSVAYYAVLIVISSFMFNLAYCAYMGMIPIISDTQEGRMKAVSAQQQMVAVFAIIISLIGVSVIKTAGYAVLNIISAAFIIVSLIPMYIATRDIDVYKPAEKMSQAEIEAQPSTWDMIRLIVNVPMIIYLLGSICKVVGSIGLTMLVSYYYTYAYGDMKLLTYYLTLSTVLQLIGASLAPFVNKLLKGNRNTFAFGLAFYSTCLIVAFFVGHSALLFTIMLSVGYMGWAVSHTADAAYYSYIGDYVEYKHGKNIQPFLMSLLSLAIKIGIAISSIVVGWGLVAIGFDANNVTEAAKTGIQHLTIILPVIVLAIGAIVTIFSPLSEKRITEIKNELHKRHNAA